MLYVILDNKCKAMRNRWTSKIFREFNFIFDYFFYIFFYFCDSSKGLPIYYITPLAEDEYLNKSPVVTHIFRGIPSPRTIFRWLHNS